MIKKGMNKINTVIKIFIHLFVSLYKFLELNARIVDTIEALKEKKLVLIQLILK